MMMPLNLIQSYHNYGNYMWMIALKLSRALRDSQLDYHSIPTSSLMEGCADDTLVALTGPLTLSNITQEIQNTNILHFITLIFNVHMVIYFQNFCQSTYKRSLL